jgi:hypothetical protein
MDSRRLQENYIGNRAMQSPYAICPVRSHLGLYPRCGDITDFRGLLPDEHPIRKDAAGFPTWQLRAHQRDTATTNYLALGADILEWRIAPSAQRAYNVVQVTYVDPVADPGSVTVSDARLGAGGAQGNAPFRRRKLRRKLGNLPMTSAQATAIANAWLATYSNPSNKLEVVLRRCATPVAIPCH